MLLSHRRDPSPTPDSDVLAANLTHRFQLQCPAAQLFRGSAGRRRRFESASSRLQAARTCRRMSQIAPDAPARSDGFFLRSSATRRSHFAGILRSHHAEVPHEPMRMLHCALLPCSAKKRAAKRPCLNQETCVRENNFAPKTVRFAWRILYILRSCGVQTSVRAPDAPRERARRQTPRRLCPKALGGAFPCE